jgi:zinc transport system permease protein
MWSEFVAGWELGLYRDPVICAIAAGLVLGYLGVFVVLKRMVFVTAAISQASGLGVALAYFVSIHVGLEVHPFAGALLVALAVAALCALPTRAIGLSTESLLALAYLGCWALAIVVGDRIAQESHDISSILFGTAVVVPPSDVLLVGAVGALVLLVYIIGHRGILFVTVDRDNALVQGLPVRPLELLAGALVALEVSVTTRALGVLPVFAFAVLPAVGALALPTSSIGWVLVTASLLGALAGGLGYLVAFFLELPVGACQAATALALAGLCLTWRFVWARRGA